MIRLKFLWLRFMLAFVGFKVFEARLIGSSRKVLRYTLNNDYNTQSGRYYNYPSLSISIDCLGQYSATIHQQDPIIKNDTYVAKSPYKLIKLWLTAFHHFKKTHKMSRSLKNGTTY